MESRWRAYICRGERYLGWQTPGRSTKIKEEKNEDEKRKKKENEKKKRGEKKEIEDGEKKGTLNLPDGSSIFRGRSFVEGRGPDSLSVSLLSSKRERQREREREREREKRGATIPVEAVYKRYTCARRSRGKGGCPCTLEGGGVKGWREGLEKNGESH